MGLKSKLHTFWCRFWSLKSISAFNPPIVWGSCIIQLLDTFRTIRTCVFKSWLTAARCEIFLAPQVLSRTRLLISADLLGYWACQASSVGPHFGGKMASLKHGHRIPARFQEEFQNGCSKVGFPAICMDALAPSQWCSNKPQSPGGWLLRGRSDLHDSDPRLSLGSWPQGWTHRLMFLIPFLLPLFLMMKKTKNINSINKRTRWRKWRGRKT